MKQAVDPLGRSVIVGDDRDRRKSVLLRLRSRTVRFSAGQVEGDDVFQLVSVGLKAADGRPDAEGPLDIGLGNDALRASADGLSLAQQQGLVRPLQSMLRVVGIENAGDPVGGKPGDRIEHDQLVFEIQIGFRLIEYEQGGFSGQGAGDQDHLQLAAAHLAAELL